MTTATGPPLTAAKLTTRDPGEHMAASKRLTTDDVAEAVATLDALRARGATLVKASRVNPKGYMVCAQSAQGKVKYETCTSWHTQRLSPRGLDLWGMGYRVVGGTSEYQRMGCIYGFQRSYADAMADIQEKARTGVNVRQRIVPGSLYIVPGYLIAKDDYKTLEAALSVAYRAWVDPASVVGGWPPPEDNLAGEPGESLDHGGRVMILTWNPDRFHWDEGEYRDLVEQTAQGVLVPGDWSTGSRIGGVGDGDRFVLLRQGSHGRGIVGSGTVTSDVFQTDAWDDSGGLSNYVEVLWERVVPVEDALPTDTLKSQLPETNWDRLQMSGTLLKPALAPRLAELWSDHLAEIAQGDSAVGGGQGIVVDAALRRKIEDAAQDRLMDHYRRQGWTVTDTRYGNPFDAIAQRGDEVVYLEAKGTQSSGATVRVTRDEVGHARANRGQCVIGIWSGIALNDRGEVERQSGRFEVMPFEPADEDLVVVAYDWRVPAGPIRSR